MLTTRLGHVALGRGEYDALLVRHGKLTAMCIGPRICSAFENTGAPLLCMGRRYFSLSPILRSRFESPRKLSSFLALIAYSPSPHPKATKISVSQGQEIINKQRLNRPIAPHLEVYRLSQTYLGSSAWMRITGSAVMGIGYVYFGAYLLSPLFGVDVGSASIVSAFAGLPGAVKTGIKFALAWPFSFHFCNGIKQLLYDSGWAYP